ncbi:MBL fold metallo-hydrolase [Falsiroseomonas oryzae]|uniref:MBL fold metallo-hydrolase n=1 Tax=Falsiroseomonas oryzae TaxID=2766473 RepID=UPI0022EA1B58|nr:MBL fold metallo-hydrolase [Roseomonas sp. MO-31]
MITRRLALGAAAALAVLPVRPDLAAAQTGPQPGARPVPLDIAKFDRPGEGSVNSFILVGERSCVILDCQRTRLEARHVVSLARGTGLPVEAIFLSHEHPDHIAGLETVAAAFPDAPIMAGETTRDWIAANRAQLIPFLKNVLGPAAPDGVPLPTRVVRPGEVLILAGSEWRVDQIGPCEASGMTMLHNERHDVLFAADLFDNRFTPWLVDGTTGAWIAEIERNLPRYGDVGTALVGHGAAGPARPMMQDTLGYLRFFREALRRELPAAGDVPAEGRARIRAALAERYPGYPQVVPLPTLLDMNVDAVARELRR